MARWKVIISDKTFLTICDYHIDAIRTSRTYPIEPLLSVQGMDYGWKAIRREQLTVGAEKVPTPRKVKYGQSR